MFKRYLAAFALFGFVVGNSAQADISLTNATGAVINVNVENLGEVTLYPAASPTKQRGPKLQSTVKVQVGQNVFIALAEDPEGYWKVPAELTDGESYTVSFDKRGQHLLEFSTNRGRPVTAHIIKKRQSPVDEEETKD